MKKNPALIVPGGGGKGEVWLIMSRSQPDRSLLLQIYAIERHDEQSAATQLVAISAISLTYIAGASVVLERAQPHLPSWLRLLFPVVLLALYSQLVNIALGINARSAYVRHLERLISGGAVRGQLSVPYWYRVTHAMYFPPFKGKWVPQKLSVMFAAIAPPVIILGFIAITFTAVPGTGRWFFCTAYVVIAVVEYAALLIALKDDEEYLSGLRNIARSSEPAARLDVTPPDCRRREQWQGVRLRIALLVGVLVARKLVPKARPSRTKVPPPGRHGP